MVILNKGMEAALREAAGQMLRGAEEFVDGIVAQTRQIDDCILYGAEELDTIDERLLKRLKNQTAIEISLNELQMGRDLFPIDQLPYLCELMKKQLETKYHGKSFKVIIILQEEDMQLRFYTVRPDEPAWLDENLDDYQEAILTTV